MRIWLAMTALIFSSTCWGQKTLVIVDIDDTIRMTHRKSSLWEQLQNVSDPGTAFYGMREILEGFDSKNAVIYYVSGTIAPISDFSAGFLYANDFPQQDHYLYRGWFEDTQEFKVRTIDELSANESPDRIIMLGDNGEQDSAAYLEVAGKHPNSISYIHKIYGADGVDIPNDQSLFLTAADLALQLYLAGDLDAVSAQKAIATVIDGLASEDSFYWQFVFPTWADISMKDIERGFSTKDQWPDEWLALYAIENHLAKSARTSSRYFHLCQ
jgi:hypothetical protein